MRRPALSVSAGAENLRLSAISAWACKPPETPRAFRERGCREPETVGSFHHGGANRLRRPAIFVSGVDKKRRQPETVVGIHHVAANRLRRRGVQ